MKKIIRRYEKMENKEIDRHMHIQEALKTAIEMEKKSREFFMNAIKCVDDPAVKALFSELAEEEKIHQIRLEREMERGVFQEM